jgi:hypothetical protein
MKPWRVLARLALLLCWVAPSPARAWGDDGHRVIGHIASRMLTEQARAALDECLTEPGYETLAEAATWPDTHARRFRQFDAMKPYHYVNVPARARAYDRQRDCAEGCVVTALEQFVELLAAPELSLAERRNAVYWVAHLVGDIHQPLHVAHPDGKGGNLTRVSYLDLGTQNLHWVWDVGLIEQGLNRSSVTPRSWSALAEQLLGGLKPSAVRSFQRVTAAEALVGESLALAKRHAYATSGMVVDEQYVERTWPVVALQLQMSGVRLAAILNRALARRT